ncbi:MAG: EAL domain-containing protein, partial [Gammaproteobacteria bacterium]|nr:EAL domain-containing protein [Gammaproteobacteria bacterium]
SANEELESSKEELQSLNEELTSSNSLLDEKVVEVEALNADLNNLLNSTNTATLLMDVDLNIRRFTPACSRLMRLIPTDIGRSVDDVVRIVDYPALSDDCQQVIRGRPVDDLEVSDPDGHWYLRRILPFLDQEEQVDGAVITFTDITALKRADHLLRERNEKLSWQSSLLSRAAPVVGRDMQDRIVFWNKGAESLYGWSESEALGARSHELLKTRFPLPLEEITRQLLENSVWRGQLVHAGRDGSEIIVQSQWTEYHNAAAEPEAVVEVNNDVTKQKQAQQALRESEEMFHTMVDWTYNWEYWSDPEDNFVYMTPSVEDLTGYRREEFDSNPGLIDMIVHPDDRIVWKQHRHAVKHDDGNKSVELMMRIVRKNGETSWVSHQCRPVFGQQGQDLGRRVTVRDISAQKLAEEQVHALAYYDPLTHLPNRRLLMDRLHQAIASCKRDARHGAVMMLDLDQFKTLNDSKGHDMGDALLIEVAKRVLGTVRAHDTVSRIGGDEFVVVLEDLNEIASTAAVQVEYVADKIATELRKPFSIGDQALEYFVTSSVGVAMFDDGPHTPELLLKQADVALYQAKAAGRDTIRYFNPGMQAEIDARSVLEAELRRALQNDEFRLYFQPQLDGHGTVVGAEALLRWQSADRGLVLPDAFIPLAEESGLIVQIGNWVLAEACEQLKRWQADQRRAQLHLSVNVSARQAQQAGFVSGVVQALESSGANPGNLMLELTESAVMRDIKAVAARMQRLIDLGVRFSLDDFGTGYSSLSHLKTLPFSQVKIDRSFVRDLADDPNDAAIIGAILAMNASLGLPVVAEGVETEEQHAFLRDHGCSGYQGYLFGRPMPIAAFEDLLAGGAVVGN